MPFRPHAAAPHRQAREDARLVLHGGGLGRVCKEVEEEGAGARVVGGFGGTLAGGGGVDELVSARRVQQRNLPAAR